MGNLVVDSEGRVLLVRFEFPAGARRPQLGRLGTMEAEKFRKGRPLPCFDARLSGHWDGFSLQRKGWAVAADSSASPQLRLQTHTLLPVVPAGPMLKLRSLTHFIKNISFF